jgi:DNA adenine methylase
MNGIYPPELAESTCPGSMPSAHQLNAMPLTPPLKWAGGKRWLLPALQKIWQQHHRSRMVEPFCGGLAVALGLAPEFAYLNDQNSQLINFYQQLQLGLNMTINCQNTAECYYRYREQFNQELVKPNSDNILLAQLFYFLNRTGYNGLCRFNSKGEFNVPFGRYKSITYKDNFDKYRTVLANWIFSQGDFSVIKVDRTDFIYADPPYDVEFTKYSKEDFKWQDQVRLAEWLAQAPGPVVASNQATPRILNLYEKLGFRLTTLEAPRRISCTGDRTPVLEMLACKGL